MKTLKLAVLMLALTSLLVQGCNDDDSTASPAPSGTVDPMDGMAGSGSMDPADPADPADPTDPADPADPVDGPADIVDTAIAAGDFEQLAAALTAADLVDALKGEGPFTVFAPTDEAFAAFEADNPGVLESLSTEQLTEILTYHVIAGAAVRSTDLESGQLAETLAGPMLAVDLSDGVHINDASVVSADIEASNGVIHVIDRIIMPPGDIVEVATAAGSFNTLAAALTDAGLIETLQGEGPFTVFAPTDEAFAALSAVPSGDALVDVLTYHVLPGIAGPLDLSDGGIASTVNGAPVLFGLDGGATVNGATITTTNVVAKNGVIHVIDAVITPPEGDIVDVALAAGNFTALAGALTDAGLVDTLKGEGPFTVFAPTDDAFAALGAMPTGDALMDVLLYHVVDGSVGSGDLVTGPVPTKLGTDVMIDLADGVKVNQSTVVTANILATNGVIHVIDTVLVPE